MNNVKLLHINCFFFQFFNSQVALENKIKFWPQEKVEMTLLILSFNSEFWLVKLRILSYNLEFCVITQNSDL